MSLIERIEKLEGLAERIEKLEAEIFGDAPCQPASKINNQSEVAYIVSVTHRHGQTKYYVGPGWTFERGGAKQFDSLEEAAEVANTKQISPAGYGKPKVEAV